MKRKNEFSTNQILTMVIIVLFAAIASFMVGTTQNNEADLTRQITVLQTSEAALEQDVVTQEQQLQNILASEQAKETQLNENLEFFKEYASALVSLHVGLHLQSLADVNFDYFIDEYDIEDYSYYDVEYLSKAAKEQALDSKEFFMKANKKFKELKEQAPNDFFKEELVNRIEQSRLWVILATLTFDYVYNYEQSVYEVNYGTRASSDVYYDKYILAIDEYNEWIYEVDDVEQEIDLAWDQDWYIELD